jgi:predicted dehydrogenase
MKTYNRRKFIQQTTAGGLGLSLASAVPLNAVNVLNEDVPIGVIGMDTSHSVAFSKYINSRDNGFRAVAAFTTVSNDIPSSYNRVDNFTEELKQEGLKIVDSIDLLLESCDCILLETNDGRLHLEQAKEVFDSGKRVFIDKPVAASIQDVKAIYQLAQDSGIAMFSSSGTRYMSKAQAVRDGSIGEVLGADTYSPVSYEPSHSDLYWYGIHGVELLFTVMKTGCVRVRRTTSQMHDTVIGEWKNGGIGTFRGLLEGDKGYGGQAFGTEGLVDLGSWEGYEPLVEAILQYFRTGTAPVPPAETLEIYAFMEAAKMSSENNGAWINLDSI